VDSPAECDWMLNPAGAADEVVRSGCAEAVRRKMNKMIRRPSKFKTLGAVCLSVAVAIAVVGGCMKRDPVPTVAQVDLQRFMGSWYVLAHVPASLEKEAYAAVETYRLEDDGTIDTTYVFNRGSLDGPEKKLRARGFVHDKSTNADWRMQFIWPFRHEYLIAYLDETYERCIVARTRRDMAWIMSKSPHVSEAELRGLVDRLVALGYEADQIRIVPQRPDGAESHSDPVEP
jgi:apolipoprotein D and lipocalin family protein